LKKYNKIIIVGGTGFIGFHLAKFFLKKKWKVVSISRKKPPKIRFLKKVHYINFDISKKKFFSKKLNTIKNVEYVINASGEVDHKNKKKVYLSHFIGVKNLANFFIGKNLKKFIQFGSSLEYGKKKSPHYENFKIKPVSNYAKAKSSATNYLLNLNLNKNFPTVIVRPYQVYGPHQDTNRFIPIVINNCLKNNKFPCSDGFQKRDFLFVDDFIKAIYALIKKDETSGEVINIGSGKALRLRNIIFLIKNIIKKGNPVFGKIKMRKEENMITYPNIRKLIFLTKWKPSTNFRKGIIKTINYFEKNL